MRFRIIKNGKFPSLLLKGSSSWRRHQNHFFLINPVEGIGPKLRRHPFIQHYLITRKSWRSSLSGLPGILTDVLKSKEEYTSEAIFIHGPQGTSHIFKALKYVFTIENDACLFGIEPRNSVKVSQFRIKQNWSQDENALVRNYFEDGDIRICHYLLESSSVLFPSEIQYPAWNNLSINFGDEISYPSNVPRDRTASSYLISDSKSKVLVLDVPDISYLESLHRSVPSVEALTVFDFSPAEVKEHQLYKEWSNSVLHSRVQVVNLEAHESKEGRSTGSFLNKLGQIYPSHVFQYCGKRNDITNGEIKYPNLTFLGTGSKRPTAHRNVSGILLRVSSDSCGLIDCGENTYHRLLEAFGRDETIQILKTLRFIFISHRHNDHHMGLFTILQERESLFDGNSPKIYLIAPRGFKNLFKHYHGLFEDVITSVFHINTMRLVKGSNKFLMPHLYDKFLMDCGLDFCETFLAEHIKNSYSINLSSGGWKILYTGDTKPNFRLKNKCPDVLIHEATLPSYLGNVAHEQLHSTTQDAIDAYYASKAGFLILTHFSESYDVMPYLETAMISDRIAMAFDFLTVNPASIGDIALNDRRYQAVLKTFEKDVFALRQKKRKWNFTLRSTFI